MIILYSYHRLCCTQPFVKTSLKLRHKPTTGVRNSVKTHNIARYRGLARGEGEPSVHPHLVPIFSIEIVKIVGTYGVPNPSPPPSFGQNFHIKYTVEVRR